LRTISKIMPTPKSNMKIKENFQVINPIYEYMISSMAFKTWRKYANLTVEYVEISPRRKRVSLNQEENDESD